MKKDERRLRNIRALLFVIGIFAVVAWVGYKQSKGILCPIPKYEKGDIIYCRGVFSECPVFHSRVLNHPSQGWYVDAQKGKDTNSGSKEKPFRTFAKAMQMASAPLTMTSWSDSNEYWRID